MSHYRAPDYYALEDVYASMSALSFSAVAYRSWFSDLDETRQTQWLALLEAEAAALSPAPSPARLEHLTVSIAYCHKYRHTMYDLHHNATSSVSTHQPRSSMAKSATGSAAPAVRLTPPAYPVSTTLLAVAVGLITLFFACVFWWLADLDLAARPTWKLLIRSDFNEAAPLEPHPVSPPSVGTLVNRFFWHALRTGDETALFELAYPSNVTRQARRLDQWRRTQVAIPADDVLDDYGTHINGAVG
jgi:hypothetical protein